MNRISTIKYNFTGIGVHKRICEIRSEKYYPNIKIPYKSVRSIYSKKALRELRSKSYEYELRKYEKISDL